MLASIPVGRRLRENIVDPSGLELCVLSGKVHLHQIYLFGVATSSLDRVQQAKRSDAGESRHAHAFAGEFGE